jgi:hypothetical protein
MGRVFQERGKKIMKNFMVRITQYVGGVLQTIKKWYNKLEDAIKAGLRYICHAFKVYNKDGECCHSSHPHGVGENPYC